MNKLDLLRRTLKGLLRCGHWLLLSLPLTVHAQTAASTFTLPKFTVPPGTLSLTRRTQAGSFYDVTGRRSAVYGYEHQAMEAWVHPLKLIDNFRLSFAIENYPLAYSAEDLLTNIEVRPEATTFIYAHAAFKIKQTIFAPIDDAGIIMLFDVDSSLPLTISAHFRPQLKLAWLAPATTPNLEWNKDEQVYYLTEESRRFVGIIGSPYARDVSVQPYQEEPRDTPAAFNIQVSSDKLKREYIPIIIAAASVEKPVSPNYNRSELETLSPNKSMNMSVSASLSARAQALATYHRLLSSIEKLYRANVRYYQNFDSTTLQFESPDPRFNTAFSWAKIGTEKGFATNPFLGTGLVAGFRTSGNSERPGFAWFFGRDALWTALAINSYGDYPATRTALDFLSKFQRADGKIPHEISQSATFVAWFNDYPYAWAAADATPLYVILHHDLFNATGDKNYLSNNWQKIKSAYAYSSKTDTDNNGLLENTRFGHGWVEGGALYPPHEEIYMQGLWVHASRAFAELALAMNDKALATQAQANAERTRQAMENRYWLADKNFYAFATQLPSATPKQAEPGPSLAVRQKRLNELQTATLIDEDTVLPAVPMWWKTLDKNRAQTQLDRLGGHTLATDWGARIISNRSQLYDPLSYHYGSVWGLFTGWSSLAAYNYGRPHIGYQALYANMNLTFTNALGYVTELLSGDFQTPFGRSSHHQIWSEAMVISPAVRGLLGLEIRDAGKTLRLAPQMPADWDFARVRNVNFNYRVYDFSYERAADSLGLTLAPGSSSTSLTGAATSTRVTAADANVADDARVSFAPALPHDARVRRVTLNNREVKYQLEPEGDVQRVRVEAGFAATAKLQLRIEFERGTEVFTAHPPLEAGARSTGLRIIRAQADDDNLRLTLEGVANKSYPLGVRTTRRLMTLPAGVTQVARDGDITRWQITFPDSGASPVDNYVRRELVIGLQ